MVFWRNAPNYIFLLNLGDFLFGLVDRSMEDQRVGTEPGKLQGYTDTTHQFIQFGTRETISVKV